MRTIHLKLPGGSSEIRVGAGSYRQLAEHLETAGLGGPFLIVSQPRILAAVDRRPLGRHAVVTIPEGERAKTLRTVERLLDRMLELGLSRQATVVALGGGVVGDVAGFAASIYLRGIPVVQVPTTLLAQVDSSVGGKTGVNHPAGKNLIGTFHQPRLVLADPSLLASLPEREYRSGLYEALKYGVIRDPALFERFERRGREIADRAPAVLEDLVYRCLRIKADVVAADEKEGDLRRILNFGHTLGHAIEAASGYRRIRHGEAVGYGMVGAARLAARMDRLSLDEAARIESRVRSLGRLPSLDGLSAEALMQSIKHDKKIRDGRVHFVLPVRIGKVVMDPAVPPRLVRSVVRSLLLP